MRNLHSITFKILCQVTDTDECFPMGRQTARVMRYVSYPEISPPAKFQSEQTVHIARAQAHTQQKCQHTQVLNKQGTLSGHTKQSTIKEQANISISNNENIEHRERKTDILVANNRCQSAVMPKHPMKPTSKLRNSTIIFSGKEHSLLTTKDYIRKEYADVFNGIGTLPGPPYHIQLKEDYEAVQHAPCTVPVGMQQAYQAELQRLLHGGVIGEVHGYTEWVNSIIPVQEPNGEIRLCLDPRDLNKVMKRNAWCVRTLDDVLPQLSSAKTVSMTDATSRYWHVILDLQSSLLTMFNTPWGKFRWLILPF